MNRERKAATIADPKSPYQFWLPPDERRIKVGPEQEEVPLPQVPLPIKSAQEEWTGEPTDVQIGSSVYDYLRQFPDCQYNREYAELLRDAFPHYISDLASQSILLGHKDVAAAYLQRLVNYLKILLLLDPQNRALQQQIGLHYYQLAMNFETLPECRKLLQSGRHYLLTALGEEGTDSTALNYLAHIAYLVGDYAAAGEYWQRLQPLLDDADAVAGIETRLQEISSGQLPPQPLLEELEQVGEAMLLYGAGDYAEAKVLLEVIEEQGALCQALPMAEFHYLLGMCRLKTNENAAAFDSLDKALRIDPAYEPALEAQQNLLNQGG